MKGAGLLAASVLLVAAGCGSAEKDAIPQVTGSAMPGSPASGESPTPGTVCTPRRPASVVADVDGSGTPETVTFQRYANCAPTFGDGDGPHPFGATVEDLQIVKAGLRAVRIAGRTGQLVLLVQSQPRGGYQAHLFGYADDAFAELKADGKPIFPFVATDTGSSHLAAHCLDGGFDIETAAHSSKRTWNVSRTVYQVAGNTVTAGETTLVAQDISDLAFQHTYGDLASDELFADCT